MDPKPALTLFIQRIESIISTYAFQLGKKLRCYILSPQIVADETYMPAHPAGFNMDTALIIQAAVKLPMLR